VAVVVVSHREPPAHVLADDALVAVVRSDHPAARRGVLEPSDIRDATYATAGERPRHGFEHHEFFEPADVRPHRLRKIESLAMVLRLIRAYGGMTVQPALALRDAPLSGLSTVPLRGDPVRVRWQFLLRPDPRPIELDVCEEIRRLVAPSGEELTYHYR
jgi:DNA-binding transcriptional LysR family regulator